MVQISLAGSTNLSSLSADDVYLNIVAPPAYITGVPTDVIGLVGTASWGPLNTPVHLGGANDAVTAFGNISALSLTDPYDLATDLYLSFGQAKSSASLEGFAVRVSDGTDAKASITATGTAGKAETFTVTAPTAAGESYTISAANSGTTLFSVAYSSLAADTADTVATALTLLLNAQFVALGLLGMQASVATDVVTFSYDASYGTLTLTESSNITAASGTPGTAGATITALYSGILGNQIQVVVSESSATGKYTASIQNPFGQAETFANLPEVGFFPALATAINNGQSGVRGPSQYVRVTGAQASVGVAAGTLTLAGGTDGRSGVTTANLLGSDAAYPATGLYALGGTSPAVGIAWIVGSTDQSLPTVLAAFGTKYGISTIQPFPVGTSTAAALALVKTIGVESAVFAFLKDWIYFYDQVNAQIRLVPPTAVIGGFIATLTPEQSPGNKQVSLVLGTERNNTMTGTVPYMTSEIGELEDAGIMFIANPIPAGQVFGIRHGQTTAPNGSATKPFEYWRMTSFLARSIGDAMGPYVDALQSQQPDDELRRNVKLELNNFFDQLVKNGQIDQALVTIAFSTSPQAKPGLGMNTPASVAQHYLYALCQVTYLSSVRFFVVSLQGGTTVVTVNGALTSGTTG